MNTDAAAIVNSVALAAVLADVAKIPLMLN